MTITASLWYGKTRLAPGALIITLLLCLSSGPLLAQRIGREWIRQQNIMEDPSLTFLVDLAVDADDNVYAVGFQSVDAVSFDHGHFITIKYDAAGNKIWQRIYDDHFGDYDMPSDIAVDGNGGVYVTGTSSTGGRAHPTGTRAVILKYNQVSDTPEWVKRYVEPFSKGLFVKVNNTNGDIVVAGYTPALSYIVRAYKPSGANRWEHARPPVSSASIITIKDLQLDNNGNVYVTGKKLNETLTSYIATTIKFNLNGEYIWTRNFTPLAFLLDTRMAVDDADNAFLVTQWADAFSIVRQLPSGSSSLEDLPGVLTDEGYGESFDIAVHGNALFVMLKYNTWTFSLRRYNFITGELEWEINKRINFPIGEVDWVPLRMQLDEEGNVYVGGPNRQKYRLESYTPEGTDRWTITETVDDRMLIRMQVVSKDKIYVIGGGVNSPFNYLVAKYTIRDSDPPLGDPIIPSKLSNYHEFVLGAYGYERDWCWTDAIIDWDLLCISLPFCPDPDPSQVSLSEKGKIVWQATTTIPASFTLPVDDNVPRTLSFQTLSDGNTFDDVVVLDENLVSNGISSVRMAMYPDPNIIDLKVETDNNKIVPFTMSLLNEVGKEVWQKTFTAPLQAQLEEYASEPGTTLRLQAVPQAQELSYYPNPFSDKLIVQLDASKTAPVELSVYSAQGKKLLTEWIDIPGEHTINMSNLQPGLYILSVKANGKEVKKLVELKR